ncbi:MAG: hypothetical protein ABWY18_13425, partial [Tardiphaga sp.]
NVDAAQHAIARVSGEFNVFGGHVRMLLNVGIGNDTKLSSPGLTGRPSTPRPRGSITGACVYWATRFRGW